MERGTDVRERVTGKCGVVICGTVVEQGYDREAYTVLFPSIKGWLNLDGTTDSGLRDIPADLLEAFTPPTEAVMEAIANVLQAKG